MDLLSAEALLALLIVAFYLKDSLLLLRADEAVLVRGLGGRWRAGFGARGYKLAGKEPYLANPLTPHAPVFRLCWSMAAAGAPSPPASPPQAAGPTGPWAAAAQLTWLAPFAWISWLLLFVLIPTTVLAQWGTLSTLLAVGLLYLNIVAALIVSWCLRKPLAFSGKAGGKAFALLGFECLVCAPYSANLVRRVALARPVAEDFTAAAARLLPEAALADMRRECLARIDEQLEAVDEGSAAALALQGARERFLPPPAR